MGGYRRCTTLVWQIGRLTRGASNEGFSLHYFESGTLHASAPYSSSEQEQERFMRTCPDLIAVEPEQRSKLVHTPPPFLLTRTCVCAARQRKRGAPTLCRIGFSGALFA